MVSFEEKDWEGPGPDHSTWVTDHNAISPEEALIAFEESDEVPERATMTWDDAVLDRLPKEEADLLTMYYVDRKSQHEIAQVMRCSQPAISYAISRAQQRVRWIMGPGSWFTSEQFRDACRTVLSPGTTTLMATYWQTTSQTATGLMYGMLQGRTRHAIHHGTARLASASYGDRRYSRYALGFSELEQWGQGLMWTSQQTNQLRLRGAKAVPRRWQGRDGNGGATPPPP